MMLFYCPKSVWNCITNITAFWMSIFLFMFTILCLDIVCWLILELGVFFEDFEDYGSLKSNFLTKNVSVSLIIATLHQILALKCDAKVCDWFYTRVTQENTAPFPNPRIQYHLEAVSFFYVRNLFILHPPPVTQLVYFSWSTVRKFDMI